MISSELVEVLRTIHERLDDSSLNWVVTGSVSFAVQGLRVTPRDIDIQTDVDGAYEIERLFASSVTEKVGLREEARIRSHFGKLTLQGFTVEIMGDIQKRGVDGRWEEPVALDRYKRYIAYAGMRLPVLSLEYEHQAYLALGRHERARMLEQLIMRRNRSRGDTSTSASG